MKILFGALSGLQMADRRERCRATWFKDATRLGHEAYFLIGTDTKEPSHVVGDELRLPAPNLYDALPQRTRAWCEWAVGRGGWDWLFKCDDDTYVSVPRLTQMILAIPPKTDYAGAEWHPGVNYGSGGAGYLLSRKAATLVAKHLTCPIGSEDLEVGRVMRDAGIPLHIDRRLMPFGSIAMRPLPTNDIITAHAFSAEQFLDCHIQLANSHPE